MQASALVSLAVDGKSSATTTSSLDYNGVSDIHTLSLCIAFSDFLGGGRQSKVLRSSSFVRHIGCESCLSGRGGGSKHEWVEAGWDDCGGLHLMDGFIGRDGTDNKRGFVCQPLQGGTARPAQKMHVKNCVGAPPSVRPPYRITRSQINRRESASVKSIPDTPRIGVSP